jgi:hypothetical protein
LNLCYLIWNAQTYNNVRWLPLRIIRPVMSISDGSDAKLGRRRSKVSARLLSKQLQISDLRNITVDTSAAN